MPRRKKDGNCDEIKVECRCDNMNVWSWSLRNILNITFDTCVIHTRRFSIRQVFKHRGKAFHRVCLSLHFIPGLHAFCSLALSYRVVHFILWVCAQRLYRPDYHITLTVHSLDHSQVYFLFSSQQEEWISEISLLPHGDERSELQHFEWFPRFGLSLGNSLYSILTLRPCIRSEKLLFTY